MKEAPTSIFNRAKSEIKRITLTFFLAWKVQAVWRTLDLIPVISTSLYHPLSTLLFFIPHVRVFLRVNRGMIKKRTQASQTIKEKKKSSRWVFDGVCGAGRRHPRWIFDWLMRWGGQQQKAIPFWSRSLPPAPHLVFSLGLDGARPPTGDVSDQCSHYLCRAHSHETWWGGGQMRERCAMTRSERRQM